MDEKEKLQLERLHDVSSIPTAKEEVGESFSNPISPRTRECTLGPSHAAEEGGKAGGFRGLHTAIPNRWVVKPFRV